MSNKEKEIKFKVDEISKDIVLEDIKNLLKNSDNPVDIKYMKKSTGDIKETKGTTNTEIIGQYIPDDPSKKEDPNVKARKEKNPDIVIYYDTVAEGFRSFNIENLVDYGNAE